MDLLDAVRDHDSQATDGVRLLPLGGIASHFGKYLTREWWRDRKGSARGEISATGMNALLPDEAPLPPS